MSTIACVILVKNTEDEKRYKKEQGYFRESTEASKTAVEIPVILTGGITDAAAAEALLAAEKADMIGVGRAIAADSSWAKRAMDEK